MSTSHIRYVLEASAGNFRELVPANSHKARLAVDFGSPYAGPPLRQRETLRALPANGRPLIERHLARLLH